MDQDEEDRPSQASPKTPTSNNIPPHLEESDSESVAAAGAAAAAATADDSQSESGDPQSESGDSQLESGDDGEIFVGIRGSQSLSSGIDEGVDSDDERGFTLAGDLTPRHRASFRVQGICLNI